MLLHAFQHHVMWTAFSTVLLLHSLGQADKNVKHDFLGHVTPLVSTSHSLIQDDQNENEIPHDFFHHVIPLVSILASPNATAISLTAHSW